MTRCPTLVIAKTATSEAIQSVSHPRHCEDGNVRSNPVRFFFVIASVACHRSNPVKPRNPYQIWTASFVTKLAVTNDYDNRHHERSVVIQSVSLPRHCERSEAIQLNNRALQQKETSHGFGNGR